jgi:transcriptional regulator with XRE-family HTH domain
MATQIDVKKLALMVKSKRGNRGLRTIAKEIKDISASTLSRIELGKLPDIDSFLKVCKWLEVSPEYFAKGREVAAGPEPIIAHLRADKTLQPETADALIKMISLAYQNNKKKK